MTVHKHVEVLRGKFTFLQKAQEKFTFFNVYSNVDLLKIHYANYFELTL